MQFVVSSFRWPVPTKELSFSSALPLLSKGRREGRVVNNRGRLSGHPDEDAFEDYIFGRLSETTISEFEEHLLACEPCQLTLAEADEYVRVMKAAYFLAYAGDFGLPVASPHPIRKPDEGLRWNAAAAAVLLLTCLTALLSWRNPGGDPKTVELHAYRGDSSSSARAPAGKPLDLRLDLAGLRSSAGFRVEIVDQTGRRVWFGGIPARLTDGLASGAYWVRIAADAGEPLRENSALHI